MLDGKAVDVELAEESKTRMNLTSLCLSENPILYKNYLFFHLCLSLL